MYARGGGGVVEIGGRRVSTVRSLGIFILPDVFISIYSNDCEKIMISNIIFVEIAKGSLRHKEEIRGEILRIHTQRYIYIYIYIYKYIYKETEIRR